MHLQLEYLAALFDEDRARRRRLKAELPAPTLPAAHAESLRAVLGEVQRHLARCAFNFVAPAPLFGYVSRINAEKGVRVTPLQGMDLVSPFGGVPSLGVRLGGGGGGQPSGSAGAGSGAGGGSGSGAVAAANAFLTPAAKGRRFLTGGGASSLAASYTSASTDVGTATGALAGAGGPAAKRARNDRDAGGFVNLAVD